MVGKKECEYNRLVYYFLGLVFLLASCGGPESCGVASFTAAALDTLAGVSSAAPPPVMDAQTEAESRCGRGLQHRMKPKIGLELLHRHPHLRLRLLHCPELRQLDSNSNLCVYPGFPL
ncbi:hypothetical protein Pcinc_003259 [Petrolisthes cinctipes]|uniref:Uncharacterized protein n=1 Tax=Petrolisthes cinctipes TaxID=88211 RepID=A0AAE1GNX2_PETCI|nr:hypothetical protein Pcinc_003259 [Petrolisthes cinctipes]